MKRDMTQEEYEEKIRKEVIAEEDRVKAGIEKYGVSFLDDCEDAREFMKRKSKEIDAKWEKKMKENNNE